MKIVLDAGHGKNTGGKRSPDGKVREWNINEAVRKLVEKKLKEYENVSILTVSDVSGNTDVSLNNRTKKANDWGADLYVSIHHNAFGSGGWSTAKGMETFVYKKTLKEAVAVAEKVQSSIVKHTGLPNRGVKAGNLHVVRETKMTAILIEGGFMTNQNEAALMQTASYQEKFASGIVEGIVNHYKLKKKSSGVKKSPSQGLYRVQVGAFSVKENADSLAKKIIDQTDHHAIVIKEGSLYKVQAGAFSKKEGADKVASDISKKLKISVYIKED